MLKPAVLVLEDGSTFHGASIGASGHTVGEVVFNTAMTGYQEILTDPSYAKQIITLTYPHIGNVGTNQEDEESNRVWAAGLVIRDLPQLASNWRAHLPLDQYLLQHNLIGIAEIDTRRLTRLLREKGALSGCIMTGDTLDEASALQTAKDFGGLHSLDLAKVVSTQETYVIPGREPKFHVVAYDFGVKRNILNQLAASGCRITVVPAQTTAEKALSLSPDGIFLSNGPGDPAACQYAIEAIKVFLDKNIPLFGICLGHQLLGLACGAQTTKMKFGHHGANHPVRDLIHECVMITSQNHGFAVDETTLPPYLIPTHRSLFDGSLQGIRHTQKPAFGFQGHPEASPGPHDMHRLFDYFIEIMHKNKI